MSTEGFLPRIISPLMGGTLLSGRIEWFMMLIRALQVLLVGPEVAVSTITTGSGFLRQFVQRATWINLSRADLHHGPAMYLLLFYCICGYLSAISIIWLLLAVVHPRNRCVGLRHAKYPKILDDAKRARRSVCRRRSLVGYDVHQSPTTLYSQLHHFVF